LSAVVTNYRFYLNRYDQIINVRIFECDGADAIEDTARTLLAEYKAAAAVEAWDGLVRVYRIDRSGITTRILHS
jgi:hypothetical protein